MGKAKSTKNTIRFKCIKCGGYLRVSEKLANRYINCPKCKGRTGVPGSQEEANAEGGEYGVKEMAVEVPEECDKCGQPLRKGTVFCIGCGYDYRKGKFVEAQEPPEPSNAFVEWLQDINWGKATTGLIVLLIVGGLIGYGVYTMHQRSSGGFFNVALFQSQISQISTEREITMVFGEPRERIKMVSNDLGGEKFLHLERHAEQVRAAGLDPDAIKGEGYTMVTDVKAEAKTFMMVGQTGAYFLFYARDDGAMIIQLERAKTGGDQECNMAALLLVGDDGNCELKCQGMGPVYGAGGDMRGYYWTPFFTNQFARPDNPQPGWTYDPEKCWQVWKKAELRDFRK